MPVEYQFKAEEWTQLTIAERARRCRLMADEARLLADNNSSHSLKTAQPLKHHGPLRIFSISASVRNSFTNSVIPSSGVNVMMTIPRVPTVRVRPSQ